MVHLCSFGWSFRKATNVWTIGFKWQPKGNTGTGRCEEACGQGIHDRTTNRYCHFKTLSVHPDQGPRGKGATAERHQLPESMLEEVLQSADASTKGQDQEQQTTTHLEQRGVVVDICAGDESLRPVAEKMGLGYVGIDVKPKEKPKEVKERKRKTEEAALCLLHQGQILCARRYVQVRQA